MENNQHTRLFAEFPPVPRQAWEEKIVADLKGADYKKKLVWKTEEGFDVRPCYTAEDLAGLEYLQSLPGAAPFVRGVRRDNNDWQIRQDIPSSNLQESNRAALDAVVKGAAAVGLRANAVTTHKELSELVQGLNFDKTAIHITSAYSYPLTVEFLIYELNHRNFPGERMKGSVNFDPLSYLLLHGDFYISWENDLEEASYLLKIVREKLPHFRTLTINGHYFQDAGSTLVQELAFSLASASEYLAGLTDRGFTVDEVAPHMMFSLATGPNYFMEIAKLRAVRLLWNRLAGAYGHTTEEPGRIFVHAANARWNKTIFDSYVNILRSTTETMAAALGNADSITSVPFDMPCREPGDFSSRVARNQQLVLKEEAYLNKIADPGAGSYYIENLTHSIATHAWALFLEIEERGGMLACIRSGYLQDRIEESRNRKAMEVAQGKLVLLGTNKFPNLTETVSGPLPSRHETTAKETAFRKLLPFRVGAEFEQVRMATENHVLSGHARPSVFLFTMGNLAMLRARAGFAANFFGCAGYEIIDNPGFSSIDEGVEAALGSGARILVFCSSDEEYADFVPAAASRIKTAAPELAVIVAGYPKEQVDAFKAAGVDDFIHVRSNLLETLKKYQSVTLHAS